VSRPLAAFALTLLIVCGAANGATHENTSAKTTVSDYVSALSHERYDAAYRLLVPSERSYFRNASNFASIFTADGVQIHRFRIVGSRDAGSLGSVWVVSEAITFLDHAHQASASATAKVPYGAVPSGGTYRIKDPFHPWKAFRVTDDQATVNLLRVTLRKVSFFAGRIEVLVTFANLSDRFVTLLPYGRSVLRDDLDRALHPLATKALGLTDKTLYLGLRLASSAQYTGALNFATASKRVPRRLQLTLAPMLQDGADAPFEVALPAIDVPG